MQLAPIIAYTILHFISIYVMNACFEDTQFKRKGKLKILWWITICIPTLPTIIFVIIFFGAIAGIIIFTFIRLIRSIFTDYKLE